MIAFLNLDKSNQKLATQYRWIIKVFVGIILVDQLVYFLTRHADPTANSTIYNIVKAVLLFLTLVNCLYAISLLIRTGKKLANILLFATGLYFLGSLVSLYIFLIARYDTSWPLSNLHPTFFNQIGFLLEVTVFSVGLGYRLKLTEGEKERVNENYIEELKKTQSLELEKSKADKERELNQERNRFYTNITHEFRTPLTVIMGMAERLGDLPKEQRLISRNSRYLLRLINQMLDLSKLEAGHLKVEYIQGDIVTYLKYLTESFQSMAEEKEIDLHFYTTEEKVVMDFDEEKMQHIIFNLLSNAIKFTDQGGNVKVIVSTSSRDTTPQLCLQVQDNGQGISQEQLPKIFDAYYQVADGKQHFQAGSGIGLAFTKELVNLLMGVIEVESKPQKGTTFTLFFPIHTKAPRKSRVVEPKEFIQNRERGQDDKSAIEMESEHLPSLLIIEDNQDVADYIRLLLENEYHISHINNGVAGIEKAIAELPDLIISDVMMPEKNGYEVCAALKSDERTSHIPIILLTARSQQLDKLTGLREGADAYLTKPFDKEELFIRIRKLLELRKALQEKYGQPSSFEPKVAKEEKPTIEDLFLEKVREAIEEEIDNVDLSIPQLGQKLHLSNIQFYRKIKALTGRTPTLFIRSYRLQKARYLLQTSSLNVSEIAYDVGFSDPAYFSRAFKQEFGVNPSSYLEN